MIEAELADLLSAPNALLKTKIVEPRSEPPYQKHHRPAAPGLHNSILEEMYNWRPQFVGRSALEFKHCVLTIHIRRELELRKSVEAYFLAWAEEPHFLVKALDAKWLVSACDTYVDHCGDDAERATALVGATLIKTIKIYETERLFRLKKLEPEEWPKQKVALLFDGVKTFNVGYGDVIFNLKQRIKNLARRGTPAALILDELFERACKFDTAFSRWRAEHTHAPTRW